MADITTNLLPERARLESGDSFLVDTAAGTGRLSIGNAKNQFTIGENILDNGSLLDPVNQRRQTVYNTPWAYAIDRWFIGGAGTIEITAEGTVLKQLCDQFLENPKDYSGKTLTMTILLNDGTLKTATFNYVFGEKYGYSDGTGWAFSLLPVDDGRMRVRLTAPADNIIPATAVKLELGEHQTLAHQDASGNWVLNAPPPNKALELLKCQRYYQLFSSESARPASLADYRPPMRANPALGTIVIDGTMYYTADANL